MIRTIKIKNGWVIDSIVVECMKGRSFVWKPKVSGNDGTAQHQIVLEDGVYVTEVEGSHGRLIGQGTINSLTFVTNMDNKFGPYGRGHTKSISFKDSETVKGSKRGDDKSMEKCKKSLRANKTGVTANSTSANSEVVSRQSASRRTSGMNTTKHVPKSTGAVFTFKSDERAEKRKEYNMKLEEKLLAKEAKMSEMQAKSQYTFGLNYCFHEDIGFVIARIGIGFGVQILCSYVTSRNGTRLPRRGTSSAPRGEQR